MQIGSNIKRILCYGDSNTWGWVPSGMGQKRFSIKKRWPGILQKKLGENYEVIENGIGGRNTIMDDLRSGFEKRNGLETLPLALEANLPLDWIIIMLGTTETKEMFDMSANNIGEGMRKLITTVKEYRTLGESQAPRILVVVPPIIIETTDFAKVLFSGGTKKSRELIEVYKTVCTEESVGYLNVNNGVNVDTEEGIHIDAENHEKLASLIYDKIKE